MILCNASDHDCRVPDTGLPACAPPLPRTLRRLGFSPALASPRYAAPVYAVPTARRDATAPEWRPL